MGYGHMGLGFYPLSRGRHVGLLLGYFPPQLVLVQRPLHSLDAGKSHRDLLLPQREIPDFGCQILLKIPDFGFQIPEIGFQIPEACS